MPARLNRKQVDVHEDGLRYSAALKHLQLTRA
jgi:hypothetical protein